MSAEGAADTLRQAASLMREQFSDRCDCAGLLIHTTAHEVSCSVNTSEWPRAVADWLDDEAEWIDAGSTAEGNPAITVARAYIGGAS